MGKGTKSVWRKGNVICGEEVTITYVRPVPMAECIYSILRKLSWSFLLGYQVAHSGSAKKMEQGTGKA